ncbi:caspase-9-like [Thunnus maccoyii]|uniref:caspase-9-like n=1 Tax=Thunnus maccoyii TaxID=8240 RepID=UPI001C4BAE42|nr:caspase-9-like [Thunnus maccoyii]
MAPKTIKQALEDMLEDLKPEDFKKFCAQLVDRRKEPRVRRNRVEGKDFLDVADVLVSTFTEQGALAVADEILKDIGCSNDAENLGKTRQDSNDRYKMDAIPCGHCLIINNVEFEPQTKKGYRTGSDIDCNKLKRRFKAFNFNVEVRTNLKQEQIKDELTELSKKDHSQYDCCVVIILSHGTEVPHNNIPGAVYGVDGELVPIESITNYLNDQHCPSLQGKPKLFFIQACGGGKKDIGFEVSPDGVEPSTSGANDQMDNIPMSSSSDSSSMSTPSDILVSYSTFPGYVSWRVPQSGSYYVETLDRILEEKAATVDLLGMLTMVCNEVCKKSANRIYKQISGSFESLCKSLYFQTKE